MENRTEIKKRKSVGKWGRYGLKQGNIFMKAEEIESDKKKNVSSNTLSKFDNKI